MNTMFQEIASRFNKDRFNEMNKEYSFQDYLDMVMGRPSLAFSAYQRLYRMIMAGGVKPYVKYRKTVNRYSFFDNDSTPIFGLDPTLESMVKHIRGAAFWHGPERRIMLLHGPVGSSKSTILRCLKRGLEDWSKTDHGAIYTYDWINLDKFELDIKKEAPCPLNDDPLKLIPMEMRGAVLAEINARFESGSPESERHMLHQIRVTGELNPHCKFFMEALLKEYKGDWGTVMEKHIRVRRIILSEANRLGIGTFQPKDPKNQDATELTGDINYLKLGKYGVDSDPRAFSFDGEFQIANRGLLEFIEVLKLEKEFLYDLLGVCQERQIKPKKFPQIDVDMVLFGHTNLPELDKLKQDNTMEALRDRTIPVGVPYLLEWSKENRILEHDYGKNRIRNQHIAPHTIEIASLFAVLTRLNPDKDNETSHVEKAKLYDGRAMPGWTEERVKELRDKAAKNSNNVEGMNRGLSARFVQNAISNALVGNVEYINPFMVLNEIKEKLEIHMNSDKNDIDFYKSCLDSASKELDDILKEEVQKALVGDESVMERLFTQYIDNVVAYVEKSKIKDPYTGRDVDPDERLMRSIEEKADVSDQTTDDFRRQMAQFMFTQQRRSKTEVRWDSNPRLAKALQKKAFEDTKDHIKLSALSSGANATDKNTQDKIDAIKRRMIENFGYIEASATDVLNYVSSIFVRGDRSSED